MKTRSSRTISPAKTRSGKKHGLIHRLPDHDSTTVGRKSKRQAVSSKTIRSVEEGENAKENCTTVTTDLVAVVSTLYNKPEDEVQENDKLQEQHELAEDDDENTDTEEEDDEEEEEVDEDEDKHPDGVPETTSSKEEEDDEEEEKVDVDEHPDGAPETTPSKFVVDRATNAPSAVQDNENDGNEDAQPLLNNPETEPVDDAMGVMSVVTGAACPAAVTVPAAITACPAPVAAPAAVTVDSKNIWRRSLFDVRAIAIPNAPDIRPMKTMNAFVTKTTVFLAYLIVHAEVGKPFPKISKRFTIDHRVHQIDAMSNEILKSDFPYTGHWNKCNDPADHIFSNKSIGTWVANSVNKVKYNKTWKVEEGRIVGNKNGLYEPYMLFLQKIGVNFS